MKFKYRIYIMLVVFLFGTAARAYILSSLSAHIDVPTPAESSAKIANQNLDKIVTESEKNFDDSVEKIFKAKKRSRHDFHFKVVKNKKFNQFKIEENLRFSMLNQKFKSINAEPPQPPPC